MCLYNRIKSLALRKKISLAELERKLGLSNGMISKWKKYDPNVSNIVPIANFFNVSVDYLLGRTDNKYDLSHKEVSDIADQVDRLLKGLDSDAKVNFCGEPMTQEQKDSIKDIITVAMTINKKKAKKNKIK